MVKVRLSKDISHPPLALHFIQARNRPKLGHSQLILVVFPQPVHVSPQETGHDLARLLVGSISVKDGVAGGGSLGDGLHLCLGCDIFVLGLWFFVSGLSGMGPGYNAIANLARGCHARGRYPAKGLGLIFVHAGAFEVVGPFQDRMEQRVEL